MSGLLRTPAPAGAGAAAPPVDGSAQAAAAVTTESLVMRLVAFSALGGFAAAHWGGFVTDPPVGRMLLVLAVATGGAAALGTLSRAPIPRPAVHAAAAVIGVATLGLGLMAAGLPGRLLLPAHWGELYEGLDRGLAGAQVVDWPYDGQDPWIRLTVLLGAPALLTVCAVYMYVAIDVVYGRQYRGRMVRTVALTIGAAGIALAYRFTLFLLTLLTTR